MIVMDIQTYHYQHQEVWYVRTYRVDDLPSIVTKHTKIEWPYPYHHFSEYIDFSLL